MTLETKTPVLQVQLSDVRAVFGDKIWKTVVNMAITMKNKLEGESQFTGKIVFTIDCRNGGIGNTEAFIQKKVD